MSYKHFNGKVLGYKVIYHPVALEQNLSFVTVNYTNTTELTNLVAFTVYVINVSAVSSGGVGPGNYAVSQTDDTGTNITITYVRPRKYRRFHANAPAHAN